MRPFFWVGFEALQGSGVGVDAGEFYGGAEVGAPGCAEEAGFAGDAGFEGDSVSYIPFY